MSWLNLNSSFNNIKGQITNFANEVLAEGIVSDTDPFTELTAANQKVQELQNVVDSQNSEISTLRRQVTEFHQQALEKTSNFGNTSPSCAPNNGANLEDSWFWTPESETIANIPGGSHVTTGGDSSVLENLKFSLKTEQENNEKLNKKVWDLENALKNTDNTKLLKELEVLQRNNEVISSENSSLKGKLNELTEINLGLSKNVEELDAEHQAATDKLLSIKTELQKKIESLQTSEELSKINFDKMAADFERYKMSYSHTIASSDGIISNSSIRNSKTVLENRIKELQLIIDELKEDNSKLVKKLESSSNQIDVKCSENDKLLIEQQKLHERFTNLKEEHSQISMNFGHVSDDFNCLTDEYLELQRKMASLRDEHSIIERLKVDFDKVSDDFCVLQDENLELQREIARLRDENMKNDRLKVDFDKVSEDFSVLQDGNLELQREMANICAENAKNERLKVDFDKVSEDFCVLQDENLDLQREIARVRDENVKNDRLKVDFNKVSEDFSVLQDDNLELQREMASLRDENVKNKRFKVDFNKVSEDFCVLQDENLELQREITRLRNDNLKNERLQVDFDKFSEDFSVLQDENLELQRKIGSLQDENDKHERLKHDFDKVSEDLCVIQAENLELQRRIQKECSSEMLYTDSDKTFIEENLVLHKQISTLKNELTENERRKIDIEKLKQNICVLQDENLQLQSKSRNLENKTDSFENDKIKKFQDEVFRLQDENIRYQQQIATMKMENANSVQVKINSEKSQQECLVLQNENAKLKNEISILTEEVTEHKRQQFLKTDDSELEEKQALLDEKIQQCEQESQNNQELKMEFEKCSHTLALTRLENIDLYSKIENLEATIASGEILSKEDLEHLFKKFEIHEFCKVDKTLTGLEILECVLKLLKEQKWKIDVLERKLVDCSREISNANMRIHKLESEKTSMAGDLNHYENECAELIKNNDLLIMEVENLKMSKLETISENNEENLICLEQQLEDCSNLNQSLEDEHKTLEREKFNLTSSLKQSEDSKIALEDRLAKSEHSVIQLTNNLQSLNDVIDNLEMEKSNLTFELNEMKTLDSKSFLENELITAQSRIRSIESELEVCKQEMLRKVQETEVLKLHTSELQGGNYEFSATENVIEEDNSKQLQTALHSLGVDYQVLTAKNNELVDNITMLTHQLESKVASESKLREQFDLLKKELEDSIEANRISENAFKNIESRQNVKLEEELQELKNKYDSLLIVKQDLSQKLEDLTNEYKARTADESEVMKSLEQTCGMMTREKNELISLIKLKHDESLKYHAEIQRLSALLQTEMQKSNALSITCDDLVEKLKVSESRSLGSSSQAQNDEVLNEKLTKIEAMADQIKFLKEKCDVLAKTLLAEQTNMKLLTQERQEMADRESSLVKELERLRQHLVQVEEANTQEVMSLEARNSELQTKVNNIEEVAKHSNTAYTSASIRANQHAETMQAQVMLITQQRDELHVKLNDAEDKCNRQLAALTNLQCALEQFQRDKEQDINNCTERLRSQIELEKRTQASLNSEIDQLRGQLQESQQGLMAATRIADQLEISQGMVQGLKQELKLKQDQLTAVNVKLEAALSNQADKIDKSLVKNLLIGYISSQQGSDKTQVLKIISTVLDFNQSECDRIGLNKTQPSWLGGLLPTQSQSLNKDSLAQAFVKFLEKESQPKSNVFPNLLDLNSSTSALHGSTSSGSDSQRVSPDSVNTAEGNGSRSHSHTNAILTATAATNDSMLPSFVPPRNTSAILKDVLKEPTQPGN